MLHLLAKTRFYHIRITLAHSCHNLHIHYLVGAAVLWLYYLCDGVYAFALVFTVGLSLSAGVLKMLWMHVLDIFGTRISWLDFG